MKKSLLVAILFLGAIVANAQYNNAVGLKAGGNSGLTFKHFFSDNNAAEFILSGWGGGFALYGLYEIHNGIASAPGLNWYYGPGVHVGSWNNYKYYGRNRNGFVLGVDFVLGMEYKFNGVPIALSLDVKPEFDLIESTGFWINGGLGVKFTF